MLQPSRSLGCCQEVCAVERVRTLTTRRPKAATDRARGNEAPCHIHATCNDKERHAILTNESVRQYRVSFFVILTNESVLAGRSLLPCVSARSLVRRTRSRGAGSNPVIPMAEVKP